MKKIFVYLLFTFVTVLSAFSQSESAFECSFTSNQSYKTLVVLGDNKSEAVEIAGTSKKRCHYDVKGDAAGNYFIFVLSNPSISDWNNEIYVLSSNKNEHDYVIIPKTSKSYPLKVEMIEGSSKIAAKKREYGITRR
jgi:hypothetical protein